MRIGILGLGEAGRLFSAGFVEAGNEVVAFDPADVETPAGVVRVNSVVEVAKAAEIVISLVTAKFAVSVAAESAQHLNESALFVDLNSGAPSLKTAVQTALEDKQDCFADGAVMGSVPAGREKTQILLSGPSAVAASTVLNAAGGNAEAIGETVGAASSRKLLRSIFVKGLGALIVESLAAGEEFADREIMMEVINEYINGGKATVERLESSTKLHAKRRSHEVHDALNMVQQSSSQWPMTEGSLAQHAKLATEAEEAEILERLRALPTAAIGDGGDRLGFSNASVKPIWHAPRLVGRALTVHAHAGDNLGVHAAIKAAKPGDILVVTADGHTDRALMGELIANRCINKGIIGFITDGAVRDRDDLAKMEFPVWAAGQSPAGPYKNGPFRINTDISIADAVCHPGDYVVADSDGVCFIRPSEVEAAIRGGEAVLAEEARRMTNILAERESST